MMGTEPANGIPDLAAVKAALVEVLDLEERADAIGPETRLVGALPEFDSLAVLELIVELERRFAITIPDDEVTADAFETVTSLTELVERAKRSDAVR